MYLKTLKKLLFCLTPPPRPGEGSNRKYTPLLFSESSFGTHLQILPERNSNQTTRRISNPEVPLCFFFFFSKVQMLNISAIYEAIILILPVNLPMVNIYKLIKFLSNHLENLKNNI